MMISILWLCVLIAVVLIALKAKSDAYIQGMRDGEDRVRRLYEPYNRLRP